MHVKLYRYSELTDTPQEWVLDSFMLEKINLFVGPNASGKTRILNTIGGLARFLSSGQPVGWKSGNWDLTLSADGGDITISLSIEDGEIAKEVVSVNGAERLVRAADGSGTIWYEQENKMLAFKMPANIAAMVHRRDALQHPFLEPLFEWGARFRHFHFSTDLGRSTVHLVPYAHEFGSSEGDPIEPQGGFDPNAVVEQYATGYRQHGEKFDAAILSDLRSIGYDCDDVIAQPASEVPPIQGRAPIVLYVKERDLRGLTSQFQMSTGMFRALSIIIHVNRVLLDAVESTLLIDDIGEGLDFRRSTELIKLLTAKCRDTKIQLMMTSNDRFVMNSVSLAHWHIVNRSGHHVHVIDHQNSPDVFQKFKYLGLSNFDLFAANAFEGLSVH